MSYFSLDQVFTANMSGNVALLGVGTATSLGTVAGNVYAFVGFVAGSVLVGRFLRWKDGRQMHVAAAALTVQLVLLLGLRIVVAVIDVHSEAPWRYFVCLVLASAMAVQTGVARRHAVQDVNTTVATMTLHDLAAGSRAAGGHSPR